MNVLFVCSGNICRSAMAELLFRELAREAGAKDLRVSSAGTLGIVGAPASREAIEAMDEIGLDLLSHRSSALDRARLIESDLVVAMTGDHLAEMSARFPPETEERIRIRAFETSADPAQDPPDLADPIGEPLPFYREQRVLLRRCLEHLLEYAVRGR